MRALTSFWSLWCKDVGSASFIGMGALFAVVFVPMALVLGKIDEAGFMLGFAIIGFSSAIAWQWNRLHASEWSLINPGFKAMVRQQSLALIGVSVAIILASWVWLDVPLGYGGLALLLGVGFLWLCSRRPGNFYLSMVAFFAIVLFKPLLALAPIINSLALPLALVAWIWLDARLWHTQWQRGAVSIYCNGMTTGGFFLPSWRWLQPTRAVDAWLFPFSYFGGPAINAFLLLIPVMALLVSVLLKIKGSDTSFLHLWVQFSVMMSAMAHWTRTMRWHSVDGLLMLPLFSGWDDFCQRYYRAQLRFLLLTALSMALTAAVAIGLFALPVWLWLLTILATVWGAALIMALGVFCRNSLHTTALMLLMILPLVTVDVAIRFSLKGEIDSGLWLAVNAGLVVISLLLMRATAGRLPRA